MTTENEKIKNLFPALAGGLEKKETKKIKIEVKKKDEIRLSQIKKKEAKELTKVTKSPYRGGGMPKGKKTAKTIVKEMAKAEMISYIQKKASKLIATQAQLAFGSQAIFLVEAYEDQSGHIKKRKILIEDDVTIENILNDPDMSQGDNYFIITKILPDHNAIKDMLDRAYDKPKQSVDTTVKEIKSSDIINELVDDE